MRQFINIVIVTVIVTSFKHMKNKIVIVMPIIYYKN